MAFNSVVNTVLQTLIFNNTGDLSGKDLNSGSINGAGKFLFDTMFNPLSPVKERTYTETLLRADTARGAKYSVWNYTDQAVEASRILTNYITSNSDRVTLSTVIKALGMSVEPALLGENVNDVVMAEDVMAKTEIIIKKFEKEYSKLTLAALEANKATADHYGLTQLGYTWNNTDKTLDVSKANILQFVDNLELLMQENNDKQLPVSLIASKQLIAYLTSVNYDPATLVFNQQRNIRNIYVDSELSTVPGGVLALGYVTLPCLGLQNLLSLNKNVAPEYRDFEEVRYDVQELPLFGKAIKVDMITRKSWIDASGVGGRTGANEIAQLKVGFATEAGIVTAHNPRNTYTVKVKFLAT